MCDVEEEQQLGTFGGMRLVAAAAVPAAIC